MTFTLQEKNRWNRGHDGISITSNYKICISRTIIEEMGEPKYALLFRDGSKFAIKPVGEERPNAYKVSSGKLISGQNLIKTTMGYDEAPEGRYSVTRNNGMWIVDLEE